MRTLVNIPIAAAALLLGVHATAIADSHRDPSFDAPHGYSRTLFNFDPAKIDVATDVAVQSTDGKVVIAGTATGGDPGTSRGAITRLKADGKVDGDFGLLGRQVFQVGGFDTRIRAVALQNDKVVVAGQWTAVGGGGIGFVARLTATGAMDPTFGPNGIQVIGIVDISDVAVDPATGRIVLAGYGWNAAGPGTAEDFAVVAVMPDGSIDTSFGSGGAVYMDFQQAGQSSSDDRATAVLVQPDGKIVVAGSGAQLINESTKNFVVVRLNADGGADASFGDAGTRIIEFDWCPLGPNPSHVLVTSMAAEPGGRIVVAGRGFNSNCPQGTAALAVLDSGGHLDSSFSDDGKHAERYFSTGISREFLNDVAVDTTGRIWLIGTGQMGGRTFTSVARLLPDSRRDTGFAGNGVVHYGRGVSGAEAVAWQNDQLIVVGYSLFDNAPDTDTDTDFLAIRLCDLCDGRIFDDGFEEYPF